MTPNGSAAARAFWEQFSLTSSKRPFEKSVAFLAGVSKYQHISQQLRYVTTDLRELRNYLLGKGGFDTVYVAENDVVDTDLIEHYMVNVLPGSLGERDRLLFYYSGHGADIGGATGYMQFSRARPDRFSARDYLAVTRCEEWSRITKAKHVLFLLDSCVSGLGFAPKTGSANVDQELLETFSGNGSRFVMTAGTAREKAFQIETATEQGYSIFTRAFLDALRSGDPGDRGFLILDEVVAKLKVRVGRFSKPGRRMTPKLWAIPRDEEKDTGTFVFLNPAGQKSQIASDLGQALGVVVKASSSDVNPPDDMRQRLALANWEVVKNTKSPNVLRRFIEDYRDVPGVGALATRAEEMLAELERQPPSVIQPIERTGPKPREERENPKDRLTYVWIPPGKFQMGCVPGDDQCDGDEKPQHPVKITKGLWMSSTEVTVAAYKRFVEATSRAMPSAPRFNPNWEKEDHPIVNVNWHDAAAYCEWAGGRLPTEAEWEYAARGGKEGMKYPWGNEISSQNAKYASRDGTAPVSSYAANGFGLYDLAGNVWEWVNDRYEGDYYSSSPTQDPPGPSEGTRRVRRGGSWGGLGPRGLRCSFRLRVEPGGGVNSLGFRCVREVIP